jgi:hypothetical protein
MTIDEVQPAKHRAIRRAIAPIFTPEQRAAADADLIASGEPLLSLGALARELGVGSGALKNVVWPIRTVRYLSTANPTRYCAKDVREAVQPHLEALRARHAAHLTEVAAVDARRATRAAASAQREASKGKGNVKAEPSAPPKPLPPAARRKVRMPEVTVIRRER